MARLGDWETGRLAGELGAGGQWPAMQLGEERGSGLECLFGSFFSLVISRPRDVVAPVVVGGALEWFVS